MCSIYNAVTDTSLQSVERVIGFFFFLYIRLRIKRTAVKTVLSHFSLGSNSHY